MLLQWPGFIGDDLFFYVGLQKGYPSGWISFTYSLLLQASVYLFGTSFCLSIINLILYFYILLIFLSLTTWNLKNYKTWILVFILTSPPASLLVLSQNRDSTSSLLITFLVLTLVYNKYATTSIFRFNIYFLSAVGILVTDIRQEARIFIPFLILMIPYSLGFSWSKVLKSSLVFLSLGIAWFALPIKLFDLKTYDAVYRSTTLINPLSYILKEKGLHSLSPDQYKDLDGYFNVPMLVEYYSPFEIEPMYKGGVRLGFSPEAYTRFENATFQLMADNPLLVVKNRLSMAWRIMNMDRQSYFYSDRLTEDNSSQPDLSTNILGYKKKLEPNLFQSLHQKAITGFLFYLPQPIHFLLVTGLVPLLLLCFLALQYKKSLLIAACSVMILIRTIVVFIFSPAGYFKYISSTWLCGWLLLFLFIQIQNLSKSKPKNTD